ncbi:MAG: NfeD family protein [Theionarchaea archaeon]|nr:NfeD family protein [Theionarchaea archaeon]
MVNKKEIFARVFGLNVLTMVIAALFLAYIGYEWLIIPALVVIFVWGVYMYRMNVKVLGMPVQSMGLEGLEGKALTDIDEMGKIKVRGEIWNAQSAKKEKIRKGTKVRIVKREGITVEVEPVED